MALWLMKQEPDCYSLAQLQNDGSTLWDGITNAQALIYLRQCAAGDLAYFYHTGNEKAVVGVMQVTGGPVPDPNTVDNPKLVAVPVKFMRALPRPVTLATIKSDPAFEEWLLVKNSRLSVMPCPKELWDRIESYSRGEGPKAKSAAKPRAVKK